MKVYKTKEYYITASSTGNRLSVGEDGMIVVKPQDEQAAQVWKFVPEADGNYRILNVQTKKVLDVIEAGTVNGAWTHLWESTDTASQLWKVEEEGENLRFCSVLSGKYLDVALEDNTHVQIWEKGGDNQLWKAEVVEKPKTVKKESTAIKNREPSALKHPDPTAIKEKEPSAIKPHEKGAIKEKEPSAIKAHEKGAIKEKELSAIKAHEKGAIKPAGKTNRKTRSKKKSS